jgi:hypothetical protein
MVYQVHSIIHRDPEAFGPTVNQFVPERWLEDTDKIPTGTWRPFERGPRNCIGQELATIEARVLIALAARRYDFTKIGTGSVVLNAAGKPELDSHGQAKVTSQMYMVSLPFCLSSFLSILKLIRCHIDEGGDLQAGGRDDDESQARVELHVQCTCLILGEAWI